MLINFCDPRLRPEIECSTISTEGYEVSNLITNSDKGFLAYACIKPPVNIDITFLCNVSISHILIWPHVGSQRSSGFQLYAKTSNDASMPYTMLASGFLDRSNSGLLLCESNVNHETLSVPENFLKRHIKPSVRYLATYINNLRICICKTDNSVPALGKIEVWGSVSSRCGKDIIASISTLWCKHEFHEFKSVKREQSEEQSSSSNSIDKSQRLVLPITVVNSSFGEALDSSLQVPEPFLDAITWEIMTQPILLPSGKIIDQSTLQKHEETEALWGRRLTDPFTGLSFSEDRKPVVATALKMRIDKFLLENSNAEEVKRLPRVLGRTLSLGITEKTTTDIPKYLLHQTVFNKSSNDRKPKLHCSVTTTQGNKKSCHQLPVVVIPHKRTASTLAKPTKKRKIFDSVESSSKDVKGEVNSNCTDIDTSVDISTIIPHLKRFDSIPEVNNSASSSPCYLAKQWYK
ncbi:RING finger protein 37 [Dufourea novaeangliae]|uniref:RING finger protein 37 n=1 Tax=Dufourea novaeangliae TaxID=178035 RepID=A0A154PBN9_DUFNO|nr:RING finger protein 37 [Dufourea novaeangliae]